MIYFLRGLEGPYQNRYFRLKPGMALGRKQGDILLQEDPTVSSLHGYVIARQDGSLSLEDAGSQNQFLVGGRKVPKLHLKAGVIFQVGQCVFEVLSVSEQEAKKLTPLKSWREIVFEAFERNVGLPKSAAQPFSPSLRVECLQGPNAEDSWFLGFGPRLFGPLSEDIEILEKESSDSAFEIFQKSDGPYIRSLSSQLTLNQKPLNQNSESRLSDGDEVQIGVSIFKVHYS